MYIWHSLRQFMFIGCTYFLLWNEISHGSQLVVHLFAFLTDMVTHAIEYVGTSKANVQIDKIQCVLPET